MTMCGSLIAHFLNTFLEIHMHIYKVINHFINEFKYLYLFMDYIPTDSILYMLNKQIISQDASLSGLNDDKTVVKSFCFVFVFFYINEAEHVS